mgnify:CR=1 FL=1
MFPLGPLIAALLVIGFTDGKTGLKAWWARIKKFRAPLWIYAVAAIFPLCIILMSIALAAAYGAPTQPLDAKGPVELLVLILIMLLLGPLPEELSFRGYGQHYLQETMSPLAASVWIGIGVLIWHAPVFLFGKVPWPFVITIVAVSVVYAWLYRAGQSLWPLVVLHFQVNYFGGEWLGRYIAEEGQIVYSLFFMAFYLIWVVLIIWRCGPTLCGSMLQGGPSDSQSLG